MPNDAPPAGTSLAATISRSFMVTAVLAAVAVALAATAILRLTRSRRCPSLLIDAVLVAIAVVAIVLQLHLMRAGQTKLSEGFMEAVMQEHFTETQRPASRPGAATPPSAASAATPPSAASAATPPSAATSGASATHPGRRWGALPAKETLPATMVDALTMYTSIFSKASYTDGSKTWRNTAPGRRLEGEQCAANGSTGDGDLHFARTPTFSVRSGFSLGSNVLTGPNSHQLGIKGDMAFTAFMVCHFTGELPTDSTRDAVLLQLYANTSSNNGLLLTASGASRTSGMLRCALKLKLGAGEPHRCRAPGGGEFLLLDTTHRYVLVVVKDYGALTVSLCDLDSPMLERHTLLSVSVGAQDSLLLSNRDMTINGAGNWNANLLAFGLFARAATDVDVTAMYSYYRKLLREADPDFADMADLAHQAAKMHVCPFDAETCAACESVTDWTNSSSILSSAGTPCLRAINTYCSNNPQNPRCQCWNVNNPQFDRSACSNYRDIFSGKDKAAAKCTKEQQQMGDGGALSEGSITALARLLTAMQALQGAPTLGVVNPDAAAGMAATIAATAATAATATAATATASVTPSPAEVARKIAELQRQQQLQVQQNHRAAGGYRSHADHVHADHAHARLYRKPDGQADKHKQQKDDGKCHADKHKQKKDDGESDSFWKWLVS
jgi:hypothetical protein